MGCGCSNRGGNANPAARQVIRQNSVAPSPFNQPQRAAQPTLPAANTAANKPLTYNVQPVTAQPTPQQNPVEQNHVRRIAWDRSRREAVRRAMGR